MYEAFLPRHYNTTLRAVVWGGSCSGWDVGPDLQSYSWVFMFGTFWEKGGGRVLFRVEPTTGTEERVERASAERTCGKSWLMSTPGRVASLMTLVQSSWDLSPCGE